MKNYWIDNTDSTPLSVLFPTPLSYKYILLIHCKGTFSFGLILVYIVLRTYDLLVNARSNGILPLMDLMKILYVGAMNVISLTNWEFLWALVYCLLMCLVVLCDFLCNTWMVYDMLTLCLCWYNALLILVLYHCGLCAHLWFQWLTITNPFLIAKLSYTYMRDLI